MLVLVQGTLGFRDLLSDLIELLFELPVVIAADFHDLGLLSLLLAFELLDLRVQVGKSIMILRHLAPINLNLRDLLFKLSIVVSQFLLLTLSILEEVLVRRPLNVCLIHLTLLRHPAMIDLAVKLVELVEVFEDLLAVLFPLSKVVIGLLKLLIGELFDLLGRHATLSWLTAAGHRTRELDQLTSKSNNSMSPLQVVGNVRCHIDLLAYERVPQRKEKGIAELIFVRSDQIVESL